jgi:hypothetical protein
MTGWFHPQDRRTLAHSRHSRPAAASLLMRDGTVVAGTRPADYFYS